MGSGTGTWDANCIGPCITYLGLDSTANACHMTLASAWSNWARVCNWITEEFFPHLAQQHHRSSPSARFLLPPIIFYAGLSVRKRHFFKEFLTISGFGIAGTYACFALLSLGLWLCFHGLLTFRVSPSMLCFGDVLSPACWRRRGYACSPCMP